MVEETTLTLPLTLAAPEAHLLPQDSWWKRRAARGPNPSPNPHPNPNPYRSYISQRLKLHIYICSLMTHGGRYLTLTITLTLTLYLYRSGGSASAPSRPMVEEASYTRAGSRASLSRTISCCQGAATASFASSTSKMTTRGAPLLYAGNPNPNPNHNPGPNLNPNPNLNRSSSPPLRPRGR